MDAWEELAKEYYERNYSESKFDGLSENEKKETINRVKGQVVHRLNILTDAFYGKGRFIPILNYPEDLNAEQEEKHQDNYQKYEMKMEQLEEPFHENQKEIERLKQEISSGKVNGVLKTDKKEDIKTLKYEQGEIKRKYVNLEKKAIDAARGLEEKKRFAKLNNSEKELFGILLREIEQKDLEKMRHNRWEEFSLDMRKKIVELLDELCDKEQWRPGGARMGMKLDMGLIEYKLLHPKEYRLFKVAEMMTSDVISQDTKDNVLEMIDKKILTAYITLSKAICDIADEEGEEKPESQVQEGIKRYLEIVNGK